MCFDCLCFQAGHSVNNDHLHFNLIWLLTKITSRCFLTLKFRKLKFTSLLPFSQICLAFSLEIASKVKQNVLNKNNFLLFEDSNLSQFA